MKFYFVCYNQPLPMFMTGIPGIIATRNTVLKDEHPFEFSKKIIKKLGLFQYEPLVSFKEITEEEYHLYLRTFADIIKREEEFNKD